MIDKSRFTGSAVLIVFSIMAVSIFFCDISFAEVLPPLWI
jgi:hypothetical protein